MEIFLYDRWPITARIRLLERLAPMQLHITARQSAVAAARSLSLQRSGLSGSWVGLMLIATVTSLPELVTGLSAVCA
jgi:Ca2+/Na+ antiporter